MIRLSSHPIPQRPDTRANGVSTRELRTLCWSGKWPAEALCKADQELLVVDLWRAGWTDLEVATHTGWTTYTAARLRNEIGLPARRSTA